MAKGFKGEIGKQKAENKAKKQDARTAKEKREKKLNSLVASPKKWKNLEAYDIRTPSVYFTDRENTEKTLDNIKVKLDDLLEKLQTMRNDRNNTPAKQTLINQEIEKTKKKKEKKADRERALKIVTHIQNDDDEAAVNSMYEEIDYKIFKKIEPYMKEAGEEMQKHIFAT